MIDPSSSEEEGEDDSVPNVSSKGRLTNATKGTSAVSIIGGSAGSVVESNIPISGSNTDLIGNQRQSNISSICKRNDVGNIGVTALGSTSNKNEQICGSRADTGNLEVPSNGIPRLVTFIQCIIFKHITKTISVHCVRFLNNALFFMGLF
ncbi:GD17747 [Drosophila simulans]|uniref:GD17747 n=1 Tax=Drosophila simulans TaxID=7240 RepID=B4NVX3_DROSI|nr:GD17747 [Drosophila simulans]